MIERYDVNEEWAHCGIIKAGDFCFLNYCAGNVGGSIEQQVNLTKWKNGFPLSDLRLKT